MFAAFLISITPSCRGITGDALIRVIHRDTGLALPGGIIKNEESNVDGLKRKVLDEIGVQLKNIKFIYSEKVNNKDCGGFIGETFNESFETPPLYKTINELLVSQADRQIQRWLAEAMLSAELKIDTLCEKTWISCFGSGTLKESISFGENIKYRSTYLHERSAFELNHAECISSSRITIGAPIAEPDCSAWTESLWEMRRLRATWPLIRLIGPSHPQWITISEENYFWEGLGICISLSKNNIAWWPDGNYAVIKFAEFKNGKYI